MPPADLCIVNKENKGPTATATTTTTTTTTRKTGNEDGDNDAVLKNVEREERGAKEEGKRTSEIKSGGATRATTAVTSIATKIVESPWRSGDRDTTTREGR